MDTVWHPRVHVQFRWHSSPIQPRRIHERLVAKPVGATDTDEALGQPAEVLDPSRCGVSRNICCSI
jgi:hypothetical protein